MTVEMPNLMLALPETILLVTALIALVVDVVVGNRFSQVAYRIGIGGLLLTLVATWHYYPVPEAVTFSGTFVHDKLASVLELFILLLAIPVFVYSRRYVVRRSIPNGEYFILALFSILGMMVLISAHSFLTLYLGLELLSLPLYVMVTMSRDKATAPEAGMKYFVMGALASGMLLYGLTIIYGLTRSLDMTTVAQGIVLSPGSERLVLGFGLVFVVAGIAFKIAAVPFHMWAPDVYEGSPNPVVLLVSSLPKIAAFGMIARLLGEALFDLQLGWQQLILFISLLSFVLGNVIAIVQTNIKRLLAYSGIAQMGYMLLGLAALTKTGFVASLFYIIIYGISTVGAFGLICLLSRDDVELESIEDLKGLNQRHPWLAFMMLILMFSFAGIPPTAGFFAKFFVIKALVDVHLVWPAVIALLFAVVSVFYYLRVVRMMYFEELSELAGIQIGKQAAALFSINGLSMLALGIVPGLLYQICVAALG